MKRFFQPSLFALNPVFNPAFRLIGNGQTERIHQEYRGGESQKEADQPTNEWTHALLFCVTADVEH